MSIAGELAGSRTVAVLEQEGELGYHATGRSAAALLESYGSAEVRALTRASRRLMEAAETATPLLTPRPLLWTADAPDVEALADLLAERPGLRSISPDDAQAMCPVLRRDTLAAVALEPEAHDIDVAAMLQMYATRASVAGAVVHRRCRLDRAERANGRWVLHHASGTVVADIVVNAAGAWADDVAVLFGARPCGLRPLRRTIAIARTQSTVDPAWPLVAGVDEGFYFRPEGPHVLISPADETPSAPCDALPDEADVARAIERVNRVTDLAIRSVVTTWAGLRTFAPDRNPVVGFDRHVQGLFWMAGQGGYGIQMAPALARLAATLIRDDPGSATLLGDVDPAGISPARWGTGRRPDAPRASGDHDGRSRWRRGSFDPGSDGAHLTM
jgi:D-arginine dehydrogenase